MHYPDRLDMVSTNAASNEDLVDQQLLSSVWARKTARQRDFWKRESKSHTIPANPASRPWTTSDLRSPIISLALSIGH